MTDFFIGAFITAGFILFYNYTRKKNLKLSVLHWIVIILGFLYVIFVIETVSSFISEGSYKGAAVIGCLMGFIAVIWAMLIRRFIIIDKK
ncbi:MAG: hypothetical protein GY863_13000 [bacterium]|nr:hypothetical protein [bacterium]